VLATALATEPTVPDTELTALATALTVPDTEPTALTASTNWIPILFPEPPVSIPKAIDDVITRAKGLVPLSRSEANSFM